MNQLINVCGIRGAIYCALLSQAEHSLDRLSKWSKRLRNSAWERRCALAEKHGDCVY